MNKKQRQTVRSRHTKSDQRTENDRRTDVDYWQIIRLEAEAGRHQGRQRGRAKGLVKIKNLHKGQKLGFGPARISFPGN